MKRKVEIYDIYIGPDKENIGRIDKTEIELKELNDYNYVTLDDFISFYVINDLIFIPFSDTVH